MTACQIKHIHSFLITLYIAQSVHQFQRTHFMDTFHYLEIDQIYKEKEFEEFDCLCILVLGKVLQDLEDHHSVDWENESIFFVAVEAQEEGEEERDYHVFQVRVYYQHSVQQSHNH